MRRELRGIDEDGDDGTRAARPRQTYKLQMSLVQGTHGRNQGHALMTLAPAAHLHAQIGNRADDWNAACHAFAANQGVGETGYDPSLRSTEACPASARGLTPTHRGMGAAYIVLLTVREGG